MGLNEANLFVNIVSMVLIKESLYELNLVSQFIYHRIGVHTFFSTVFIPSESGFRFVMFLQMMVTFHKLRISPEFDMFGREHIIHFLLPASHFPSLPGRGAVNSFIRCVLISSFS